MGGELGDLVGGYMGREEVGKGAEEASRMAAIAAEQRRQQTERAIQQIQPYQRVGGEALDLYRDIVLGGDMSRFYTSPGYRFRVEEGMRGLERGAAARGGLLSGEQQRAAQQYAQNLASQEFGGYLGRVGGLMEQGLGAAGTVGGYMTGLGAGLSNIYTGLGQQLQRRREMSSQYAQQIGGGLGGMAEQAAQALAFGGGFGSAGAGAGAGAGGLYGITPPSYLNLSQQFPTYM